METCGGWAGRAACHGEEVLFAPASAVEVPPGTAPGKAYAQVPAEVYEAEVYAALVRRSFPTSLAFGELPGGGLPPPPRPAAVRSFKVPRTVYELFCIREYLRERSHTPFRHFDSPEGTATHSRVAASSSNTSSSWLTGDDAGRVHGRRAVHGVRAGVVPRPQDVAALERRPHRGGLPCPGEGIRGGSAPVLRPLRGQLPPARLHRRIAKTATQFLLLLLLILDYNVRCRRVAVPFLPSSAPARTSSVFDWYVPQTPNPKGRPDHVHTFHHRHCKQIYDKAVGCA
jgi:hypothetical protein